MALGTFIAIGAGVIAGIAALVDLIEVAPNKTKNMVDAYNNYSKYYGTLKSMNLNNMSYEDALGQLYLAGQLDADTYKAALKVIPDAEHAYSDGLISDLGDVFQDFFYTMGNSKSTHAQISELYSKLTEYIPTINRISNMTKDEIVDSIYSGVTQAPGVAPPNYNDTNIDVNASLKDVEPVKFWSGQELADLHNIDYDPNNYYDLIKQGTEAQVDLARFTSDQMNNASMYDDMANRTSYLDAIRSNKAEALATGATLGQRAANEVLANKEAIDSYASNQANVADARMQAVDKALLDDASAKLATREYFDKLAQSLSQDSLTLYANDTDRFGQEWLSNAERYKANQALLAQNLVSNAEMYANYISANAQINNYNRQARGTADEISWIFNNAVNAFDGDVWKAFNYTTNAIGKQYNNNNSIYEYLTSDK